jgi:hypothetical protein
LLLLRRRPDLEALEITRPVQLLVLLWRVLPKALLRKERVREERIGVKWHRRRARRREGFEFVVAPCCACVAGSDILSGVSMYG